MQHYLEALFCTNFPRKGVAVSVDLPCHKQPVKDLQITTASISQTLPYHAPFAGEELPRLTFQASAVVAVISPLP